MTEWHTGVRRVGPRRAIRRVRLGAMVVLAAAFAPALAPALAPELGAQGGRRERVSADALPPNPPYDGRWHFARIRYEMSLDGFGGGRFRDVPWLHDYPRADRNFSQILAEITTVRVRKEAGAILALNDPALFRYPIAYMAEPGFWRPNAAEAAGLAAYLRKGGFIIFDDFAGAAHWANLEQQMRRVLPDARWVRLTPEHPIFDSFYRIPSLDYDHPYYGVKAEFLGIFEDNDPSKRLIAIANYNNDLSEYWEFSDVGYFPIDLSNEAYKIGINYIVYALSR